MPTSSRYLDRLRSASAAPERAERTLLTAAALSDALSAAGCLPVLVGGGAVEIYTRSAYTTRDLDFVAATTPAVDTLMADLGFEKEGRHWAHEALGIVVEFPGTALGAAESVSIDVDGSNLHIIAIEDLVVDRLAGWKRWGWDPDGAAATLLLSLHADLDAARLEQRAATEDVADALAAIRPLAEAAEPLTPDRLRRLRHGLRNTNDQEEP
jgi:hypothetical protein